MILPWASRTTAASNTVRAAAVSTSCGRNVSKRIVTSPASLPGAGVWVETVMPKSQTAARMRAACPRAATLTPRATSLAAGRAAGPAGKIGVRSQPSPRSRGRNPGEDIVTKPCANPVPILYFPLRSAPQEWSGVRINLWIQGGI